MGAVEDILICGVHRTIATKARDDIASYSSENHGPPAAASEV